MLLAADGCSTAASCRLSAGLQTTSSARSCDIALERLYTALEREKRFTGDVTHELKTPIQTLTGSLELLTRSPLTDRQRAQAERAQRALKDMQVLVDTFLQISREAELIGSVTPDTLTRMIRHLEEIWRPQAEAKGLQLQVIQKAVCTGFYSPVLLGIVLNNLLRKLSPIQRPEPCRFLKLRMALL